MATSISTSAYQDAIAKTATFVKTRMQGEGSGHDWWHVYRVWQNARKISQGEWADLYIIELAALLHDIADHKFNDGDLKAGSRLANQWLNNLNLQQKDVKHICDIIETISYKGAQVETPMKTIEGKIVQDADRLDAIGAIGIARCFAYGGYKQRELYNPDIKPEMHDDFENYRNSIGPSLNHFYEKLLLLKDRMNTATAKKMAEERHTYMEAYLEKFLNEWGLL